MPCPDTQVYHEDSTYLGEIWAWFIIGTIVLFVRTAIRLRTVGWRKLQGDDYTAVCVWLCFVCDSVTVTIVHKYGTNLDFAQERLLKMSDCEMRKVKIGSQMQLLAWYTYTALIWALKATMLFFFNRITFGLFQQRLVKIFAAVCAVSYVAVFLTISCGCFPIQRNWQVVPRPPDKCTMKLQNFYVTTVLNVLTDALILIIPVPLLWGMKIPWTRKVALMLLLCSGIFVITAAILRIAFTLAGLNALNINRWGTRETIAGIIAVNAPILPPLFKRNFWRRGWPSSQHMLGSPVGRAVKTHQTIGSADQKNELNQYEMFDLQLQSLFDERDEQKGSKTAMVTKPAVNPTPSSKTSTHGLSMVSMSQTQPSQLSSNSSVENWDVEMGHALGALGSIRVDTELEITSESTSLAIAHPVPAVIRSPPIRPEDLGLLPVISESSFTYHAEAGPTRENPVT